MREPKRWLVDGEAPRELRELLAAVPPPPPLPQALNESLRGYVDKLAEGTALLGGAGTSALAGKSTVLSLIYGKTMTTLVLGSLLVGGTVTTGYLAWRGSAPPAATSPNMGSNRSSPPKPLTSSSEPATEVARSKPPAPRVDPLAKTMTLSSATHRIAAPSEPESERGLQTAPTGPESVASFSEPNLSDEARLLEAARSELSISPRRALELCLSHQNQFPAGQLTAERELIAIDALLRLGRRQEALSRAQPVLQRAPHSLYAKRLNGLLGRSP